VAHRITIVALIVGYLALAVTYSVLTPLGEGPDEPGHAQYVFFLAREARLPVQCGAPCTSDVPGEGHQPPLAYALAATALMWLPAEQRSFDLPGNPRFVWAGGNETNAVAHGSREYWPWNGAVLAWHLARLVNVGLGAITLLLTYWAGRRMFGPAVGLAAAAVIGLNPQFLFLAGLLTNDTLLTLLCAGLLLLLANKGRPTFGHAVAIGALLGLALITKQSALVLVPMAGLWCLGLGIREQGNKRTREQERAYRYTRRQNREPRTENDENPGRDAPLVRLVSLPENQGTESRPTLIAWLISAVVRCVGVFGTALLISGWWYLRNWQVYGDPLGLQVFQAEFVTQAFEAGNFFAWVSGLATLHDSFWARFGWMNVTVPAWVIGCYFGLECLALIGLERGLRKRRAAGSSLALYWPLILLPLLTLAWVVSFALTAGLVAWQGRLLFPALPAVAIILGYGLVRLGEARTENDGTAELQNHRTENQEPSLNKGTSEQANKGDRAENHRTESQEPNLNKRTSEQANKNDGIWKAWIGSWVLVLAGFGLALWLPFGVIRPAYPFPTLPAAEALNRLSTPLYARFAARADERGAELRGVRIDGTPRAGETLMVNLIWHALGRQNRNWQVFVHLVDGQETILAEDNREPRNGQFRMSQWVVDDWIEDPHPLVLPADLAPGTYRVRVGLWYIKTGGRAGRYSAGDELLGDFIDVAVVTVNP
jgi:hypothetical protein